jgi:hypothetical protein
MKKLFMIAVCFAAMTSIYAQTVQFGIKGGVNIADMKVDDGTDLDARGSFHVGGLAHIHVSRQFAVQPEIYYSGQGAKEPGAVYRFNYLNVPVLLQYMTGGGFRLQTGPQLGILLSAKDEDPGEGITYDVKNSLNDVDFAWSFGAGYKFPGSGFGIDARYNLGITNISESEVTEYRNRVFQVGLFYQFMNHGRR